MILAEFTCGMCNNPSVVWAHPSAIIKCPRCTRWLTRKDIANPALIDAGSDQMLLFFEGGEDHGSKKQRPYPHAKAVCG